MLPWTAQIRYCHLVHQHVAGLIPMIDIEDHLLNAIVTPDAYTMVTRIDPNSVTPNLAPITTAIGVVATRTPVEVAPDHSTDLPINSFSCDRSSSSYCCHHDTPHCRPSSHRNTSQDASRSQHKSRKQHYRPAQGTSSQASSWKYKDKRHK